MRVNSVHVRTPTYLAKPHQLGTQLTLCRMPIPQPRALLQERPVFQQATEGLTFAFDQLLSPFLPCRCCILTLTVVSDSELMRIYPKGVTPECFVGRQSDG